MFRGFKLPFNRGIKKYFYLATEPEKKIWFVTRFVFYHGDWPFYQQVMISQRYLNARKNISITLLIAGP